MPHIHAKAGNEQQLAVQIQTSGDQFAAPRGISASW
jgi:hypothetical protein